jgi:hypothetical protein
MSKIIVKICDRCKQVVAYKDSLLFGSWEIKKNFVETKKWYNGAEFEYGEAFPVAANKTYHICEQCFDKGEEKSFSKVLAEFQAKQLYKANNTESEGKDE